MNHSKGVYTIGLPSRNRYDVRLHRHYYQDGKRVQVVDFIEKFLTFNEAAQFIRKSRALEDAIANASKGGQS